MVKLKSTSLVQCARVLPELWRFLVRQSWSCSAFSQLRLESQNGKKCDNLDELALVTNTCKGKIDLLKFESTCNGK